MSPAGGGCARASRRSRKFRFHSDSGEPIRSASRKESGGYTGEGPMLRALRMGVPVGIAAGAVMAVWLMVAMWVIGPGFWISLNLVAHTFYRSAPLNDKFSAVALVIGLAVHMTVAIIF